MSTDKSKTDDSIRKALADEVAGREKDAREKRQAEMREALSAERAGRRAESDVTNRNEANRLWSISNQSAQQLIDSGAQAYADYIASSQEIVKSLITLVDAMNARMPIPGIVRKVALRPARQAIDAGVDWLTDKAKDLFSSEPEVEPVPLPTLEYNISMGNDNKLNLFRDNSSQQVVDAAKVNVTRDDNQALDAVHKQKIGTHIIYWLKQQGYEPDTEPGTFKHVVDDTPLTKDEFARLRDDPVNGLGASLKTKFGVNFEPEDEAGSTPTP